MINTMNTYLPEAQFADEPVSDRSITVKKKKLHYISMLFIPTKLISVFLYYKECIKSIINLYQYLIIAYLTSKL